MNKIKVIIVIIFSVMLIACARYDITTKNIAEFNSKDIIKCNDILLSYEKENLYTLYHKEGKKEYKKINDLNLSKFSGEIIANTNKLYIVKTRNSISGNSIDVYQLTGSGDLRTTLKDSNISYIDESYGIKDSKLYIKYYEVTDSKSIKKYGYFELEDGNFVIIEKDKLPDSYDYYSCK